MILADTSVVVTCLRHPTPRLLQIILDRDAALCGVTIAEIHAGARTPADQAGCAAVLAAFRELPILDSFWQLLGRNLAELRSHGITPSFPDALIATVALAHHLELWTYDAHFQLIRGVIPQLTLFQEPP